MSAHARESTPLSAQVAAIKSMKDTYEQFYADWRRLGYPPDWCPRIERFETRINDAWSALAKSASRKRQPLGVATRPLGLQKGE